MAPSTPLKVSNLFVFPLVMGETLSRSWSIYTARIKELRGMRVPVMDFSSVGEQWDISVF